MREVPLQAEIIGWYGALAVLGAYAMLSLNLIEVGTVYHVLNLTGACGLGLISWLKKAWQPFSLNAIWAILALIALLQSGLFSAS